MKKIKVLLALLLVGLFAGCSKETLLSDEKNVDGKVRVAFTVSGFEHELLPFPNPIIASAEKGVFSATGGSGSTDIRDYIDVLDIYVYHGGTGAELVDHVKQYATDEEFGVYETYIDTTIYRSVIRLAFHGAKLDGNTDTEWVKVDKSLTSGVGFTPYVSDAFSTFVLGVKLVPEGVESSVILSRYVGRVDLNIEEVIPESVGYIEVTIANTAKYFSPFYEEGFTEIQGEGDPTHNTIKRIKISEEHIANRSIQEQIYFIPKEEKGSEPTQVTVNVAAYDIDGELIREISVPDVSIQANKVTKLKGTIFTIPNILQEIGVDTEWDGEFPEREFE
ncbi:hypothetical protein [Albibacterium profundi]|uniref:Uncharacterized protein n=1 Tax=Albibacterium profundi TaxID=3134906 RepID=A0ABV5C9T7_9SPHI